MGLGYDDDRRAPSRARSTCRSPGFGNTVETPYRDWPAYASIVEAMSGIYDYRHPGEPPVTIPVGRARRHQLGAVRRDRHPRRAAPPRSHRRGPVRRHRDVRRDGRDDRHRHQLLVARCAARARQGSRSDLRGLPRLRRLRRRADRARAPVLQPRRRWSATRSGRTTRASRRARVGGRRSRRRSGPRSTRGRRSARSSRPRRSSPRRASSPGRATARPT